MEIRQLCVHRLVFLEANFDSSNALNKNRPSLLDLNFWKTFNNKANYNSWIVSVIVNASKLHCFQFFLFLLIYFRITYKIYSFYKKNLSGIKYTNNLPDLIFKCFMILKCNKTYIFYCLIQIIHSRFDVKFIALTTFDVFDILTKNCQNQVISKSLTESHFPLGFFLRGHLF